MTDLVPYIPTASIVPVVLETARDNFEAFLENDFELAMAYEACLASANLLWTDEQMAEAAFKLVYGDNIDDLLMAWRWQHILSNPNHPDHGRAWNVHEACERWQAQQADGPRYA
jgi:hypothetical protein